MDVAYDHIQEEVLSPDEEAAKKAASTSTQQPKQPDLPTELQEAYKSISLSPWGAKIGGFFSDVRKQGESYYKEAQQEASAAGEEALKGFTDLRTTLVNRARSMSAGKSDEEAKDAALKEISEPPATESAEEKARERTESEALRESEGLIARFRVEATKRLKEVQKAEDAADEALLKFGTNVRNFLKDAVTIAPPAEEDGDDKGKRKDVLFESKDQDGQRVIHTTRFDAQLHAIHSSSDSFVKNPESAEYDKWHKEFDVEKQTDAIASDLDKYEELRRAMEKLVPEKVEYKLFWSRYYFLRMVIESEERRRREMLKDASQQPEEPIGWDDYSDDDEDNNKNTPATPKPKATTTQHSINMNDNDPISSTSHSSTTTIQQPHANPSTPPSTTDAGSAAGKEDSLKPSRRSQDRTSQPDSDASYDLVSGATSRAPGSPKRGNVSEDDDEPDWE
ncbi:MAG: hypothetical protein Q9220_000438 [cf. Caloplaca sp. 1 TL-2023]